MKNIPQTREEWIKYDNMIQSARKRRIPVVEVNLSKVEDMWGYEYQAKHRNKDGKLDCIIASNSLNNLKKEIKARGWELAWITTNRGKLSYGQDLVDEYPYVPRYT
jgi:hypothetical protein